MLSQSSVHNISPQLQTPKKMETVTTVVLEQIPIKLLSAQCFHSKTNMNQ